MPLGVEHPPAPMEDVPPLVILALMPLGVEHPEPSTRVTRGLFRDPRIDAVRR